MSRARIHPHGGPRTLTAAQREVAEALVENDVYVYAEKGQGKSIVAAFRRYLETGDAAKITEALYGFCMMKLDYIAHFDLGGFRHAYRDPMVFLDEFGHARGPVAHSASVYTDGMTDQEVYAQMRAMVALHRDIVAARSLADRRTTEMETARELALKHGYRLERL
jgi:hypothetical protein